MLANFRASGKEEGAPVHPPSGMTLEQGLS